VGAAPLWLLCGTGAIIFVATVLVPPTAAARAPAAHLLLILLLLVLLPVVIVSIVVAIVVAVPARAPRAAVRHRELQPSKRPNRGESGTAAERSTAQTLPLNH
jgi:hypothetical protein